MRRGHKPAHVGRAPRPARRPAARRLPGPRTAIVVYVQALLVAGIVLASLYQRADAPRGAATEIERRVDAFAPGAATWSTDTPGLTDLLRHARNLSGAAFVALVGADAQVESASDPNLVGTHVPGSRDDLFAYVAPLAADVHIDGVREYLAEQPVVFAFLDAEGTTRVVAGFPLDMLRADESRPRTLAVLAVGIPALLALGVAGAFAVSGAYRRARRVDAELSEQRLAAEQHERLLLTNLARRAQRLVYLQLGVLDELEAAEHDPVRLEALFRIDHLAARLRRHTENLLLLSGDAPLRPVDRPVSLDELVHASLGEVEAIERIDVDAALPVAIDGRIGRDVAHLCSELLENATRFSGPQSRVLLRARLLPGTGLELAVSDSGIGMPPEQLAAANRIVSDPPALADLGTLGLLVIGRLARRTGVRASLHALPGGGTIATVVIPAALLLEDPATAPADAWTWDTGEVAMLLSDGRGLTPTGGAAPRFVAGDVSHALRSDPGEPAWASVPVPGPVAEDAATAPPPVPPADPWAGPARTGLGRRRPHRRPPA